MSNPEIIVRIGTPVKLKATRVQSGSEVTVGFHDIDTGTTVAGLQVSVQFISNAATEASRIDASGATSADGTVKFNVPTNTTDIVLREVEDQSDEDQPIAYPELADKWLPTSQNFHNIPMSDKRKFIDDLCSSMNIVRRSGWNARPPQNQPLDPDWGYNIISIHHCGNMVDPEPTAVQDYHMVEKSPPWDDVGYHFMVGADGTIYEGRCLAYKGSHTARQNTKKIGILFLGDFQHQWWDPSDDMATIPQLAAGIHLIVKLKNEIPTITKLGGHRDWDPGNQCPGDELYTFLGYMRTYSGLGTP